MAPADVDYLLMAQRHCAITLAFSLLSFLLLLLRLFRYAVAAIYAIFALHVHLLRRCYRHLFRHYLLIIFFR